MEESEITKSGEIWNYMDVIYADSTDVVKWVTKSGRIWNYKDKI